MLHKDSPRQERWNQLKETNPLLRQFSAWRTAYDESENPVVSSVRGVTETIGSWFDENEFAQVTRLMRIMDPTYDRESFERELREYIIPEVVDAFLSADQEALKKWCGEAVSPPIMVMIYQSIDPNRTDVQCFVGYHGAVSTPGPSFGQQSARYKTS